MKLMDNFTGKHQALLDTATNVRLFEILDFPTISYASIWEIPTLLYDWNLKKVPFASRTSPNRQEANFTVVC